jgi:uncharacterized protein (DUF1697 family)
VTGPARGGTTGGREPVLALLRAVNVGGTGKVAMPALRAAATDLGHTDVATHLATGNLVLRPAASAPTAVDALAADLADGLRDRLGLPLEVVLRTAAQIDALVADLPWPEVARDDPSHLLALFLDGPAPEPGGTADLSRYGRERLRWHDAEAYLHYPDGIGRSKVTGAVLDRLSGRRGTGRNWRTVLAVRDLLHERV